MHERYTREINLNRLFADQVLHFTKRVHNYVSMEKQAAGNRKTVTSGLVEGKTFLISHGQVCNFFSEVVMTVLDPKSQILFRSTHQIECHQNQHRHAACLLVKKKKEKKGI